MSVGLVMLVHEALGRAAQVARHWAQAGFPVVIHVDLSVPPPQMEHFQRRLSDLDTVIFAPRCKCDWGKWSIIAATQAACATMLAGFREVEHIYMASGSCLPLRPLAELQDYLRARAHTDFIESVTTDEVDWAIGGLSTERFTLRFPFSWKRQRRLFDGYVRLQRRVNFKRKLPQGLVPHLGSQWWCLTRRTLEAILNDPERPIYDRYFRRVWIPDESYFQTLARLHSRQIESRSLTLSKFDFHGKPHVFYDDHLALLQRSHCFMVRKTWPFAEKLYQSFLAPPSMSSQGGEPDPIEVDRLFTHAAERRLRGRSGLYMAGRFPQADWARERSAARYSILEGFDCLFPGFQDWLACRTGHDVHGHLFAKDRVEFRDGARFVTGCLSDHPALRDYDPPAFLRSLIWAARGRHQCFQFGPEDHQKIEDYIAQDMNAQIFAISGAWAIPLAQKGGDLASIRKTAARLQKIEAAHLKRYRAIQTRARVRIWTLAEFAERPMENLQTVLDEIGGTLDGVLRSVPDMADLSDFGTFLQTLKNQGMSPYLMGDFSTTRTGSEQSRASRPYGVG